MWVFTLIRLLTFFVSIAIKKRGSKMSILTFKGGVHPYDGKDLAKDVPVRQIYPKGEVVIPVSQHIGAPATPMVAVGERVLMGQKIAECTGFVSANIHASVSGTVKKIEPRLVSNGSKVMSIVIENDEQYEEAECDTTDLLKNPDKAAIREAIKEAGVVGLGGACFPTHVKVAPKDEDAIDYVIINAAECEPYITADYRRMVENPNELIEGLKIMLLLFDNAKGIIAVEDNKPDVIANLTKLTENEERIEVKALKTKYPQGSERHIIYAVTGRKINSKKLPADAGCIVDNVDTVYSIYRAVKLHKPLINRIVTVSGDGVNKPCNLLVPFGTSHAQLVEEAGGMDENCEKIISGGPMMGQAMFTLDVPVIKGSSSLLCFKKDEVKAATMTNCLNCGKCVSVCPEGLVCAKLAQASAVGDKETFLKYNGMECIECGTCNYICPANRNITQSVRTMKRAIIAEIKKG